MNVRDCLEFLGIYYDMKATHQLKSGTHKDAVAWQFLQDNPMPVWVFRSFHDLGGGRQELTHRSGAKVQLTNWIVLDAENPKVATVLTDEEFRAIFVKLPESAPVQGS